MDEMKLPKKRTDVFAKSETNPDISSCILMVLLYESISFS
jgi:hypothetical protein